MTYANPSISSTVLLDCHFVFILFFYFKVLLNRMHVFFFFELLTDFYLFTSYGTIYSFIVELFDSEGGIYYGKLKFPSDYPFKPPSIR